MPSFEEIHDQKVMVDQLSASIQKITGEHIEPMTLVDALEDAKVRLAHYEAGQFYIGGV
jgi:hypothetical protein